MTKMTTTTMKIEPKQWKLSPKMESDYWDEQIAPDYLAAVEEHPVFALFVLLTKQTTPWPHESEWFDGVLTELGMRELFTEVDGNFIAYIGDANDQRTLDTLFLAHIDTADGGTPKAVQHIYTRGMMVTDGETILGADNKSGVAILLHMIKCGVPGTYAFVFGEEVGRKGSKLMAEAQWGRGYKRAIQFDRYGYDSIVTHQMGTRGVSKEFAESLATRLNARSTMFQYDADDGGSYTDSYSFFDTIPECVNISVGYFDQHSSCESQDMLFLIELADVAVELDWHNLPTVQSTSNRDSLWRSYYSSDDKWDKWDDWEDEYYRTGHYPKKDYSNALADGDKAKEALYRRAQDRSITWADVFDFVSKHPVQASDILLRVMELTGEADS